MKLEISLFKFDKNSDYLPYYTKHFLKIKNEKNLLDLISTIDTNKDLGYENSEDFDLVVNGVYVKANITIEELTSNYGKELTIEPISIRRAYNDLLINDDDFQDKMNLLKEFIIDKRQKDYYQTLKPYFYASNTLNHFSNYIGDSTLLLASRLIEDRDSSQIEKNILDILSSHEVGPTYYTSLVNRIHNFDSQIEEKIFEIQDKLNIKEDIEKQNFRINTTLIIDFGNFDDDYEIVHDFKDFNFAYYKSSNDEKYDSFISKLDANKLKLDSLKLDLARNTFNDNPIITYKVATTILLDAFDNNADFIVVDNNEDFYILDYNRKELEKLCGREIILPVIHINELQKLATNNHKEAKKTLEKHQINPEII